MIRVSKALTGGAGRQFAQKNRRALRCAKHSNESLKRKSCQQRLPRFLSLISMAQKSFTPILLRKLTTPFSAGLLTPRTLNKTIKHPCLPLPPVAARAIRRARATFTCGGKSNTQSLCHFYLWLQEQHAEPEPLLLVVARAVRRAGVTFTSGCKSNTQSRNHFY